MDRSKGRQRPKHPRTEALIEDLVNGDQRDRAKARQLLPFHGVKAAEQLIPLITHDEPAVSKGALMILRDLANEAAAPGRQAEADAMADTLLALFEKDRSKEEQLEGLRLLAWCYPLERDVAPIAALLNDTQLRDPARQALERIGTGSAVAALERAQQDADASFAEAIQSSLREIRWKTGQS